jgi:hypothetical protein
VFLKPQPHGDPCRLNTAPPILTSTISSMTSSTSSFRNSPGSTHHSPLTSGWQRPPRETRRALLHHETSHIVPRYDKDSGSLLLDPYGRPVVKLKPDDWMLTGFVETVRVFGEKAMERRALNCVEESLSQTSFKFDEDDADRVNDHLAAVEREADGKDDGDTTPDTSRTGWDLVTSHPLSGEQRARADELAAMESEGRGGGDKRRKRKSTPVEAL